MFPRNRFNCNVGNTPRRFFECQHIFDTSQRRNPSFAPPPSGSPASHYSSAHLTYIHQQSRHWRVFLFNFSTNYNLKGEEFLTFLFKFWYFIRIIFKTFYAIEFHEVNVKTNYILGFPMYDVSGSRRMRNRKQRPSTITTDRRYHAADGFYVISLTMPWMRSSNLVRSSRRKEGKEKRKWRGGRRKLKMRERERGRMSMKKRAYRRVRYN